MKRVLVVDDEPQLLRAMRINLRVRGYDVQTAATGAQALAAAAAHPVDVVVLDLGLPDLDGVEVIQGLRGWTNVPIIVLSGRTGGVDKVEALDAGADDYVTKPFNMDELLARLRAVGRRVGTEAAGPAQITFGEVVIDLAARRVTPLGPASPPDPGSAPDPTSAPGAGSAAEPETAADPGRSPAVAEIRLTKTEWHILEILLRNPGKLITSRQLLTEVWGPNYQNELHYLRTYLNRLRHKLEPEPSRPRHLVTEPGMGYRFQP